MANRRVAWLGPLANAFVFQYEILAGGQGALERVHSIEQVRGSADGLTKSAILAEWRKILEVNYWPIFDIARRILEAIPAEDTRSLLDVLAQTADQLLETRLMRSHDLTGAVFQRLIADRKFLAAFYTTPASASLLAGLAVTLRTMSGGRSWSKPEHVRNCASPTSHAALGLCSRLPTSVSASWTRWPGVTPKLYTQK